MTVGSLFAGIGGFELAATWAEFEPVWSNEIDPYCCAVLRKNFKHEIIEADIKTIGKHNLKPVDIITGGFPCQDISIAKKQASGISGKRSGLWVEYKRIIKELNPSFIIIENTPQLLRAGFEKVLYDLSEVGYNAQWQCLSAIQFGLNHKRERLFVIAYPIGSNVESLDIFKSIRSHKKEPCRRKFARTVNAAIPANDYSVMRKSIDGVPEIMEQLKGYGNAIVPQVAFEIFKAIKEVNNAKDSFI